MGRLLKTGAVLAIGMAAGSAAILYLISTGRDEIINEIIHQNFLTVAEFANKKGMSTSYVYKHLNNELAPYVREINGIKRIHKDAIFVV